MGRCARWVPGGLRVGAAPFLPAATSFSFSNAATASPAAPVGATLAVQEPASSFAFNQTAPKGAAQGAPKPAAFSFGGGVGVGGAKGNLFRSANTTAPRARADVRGPTQAFPSGDHGDDGGGGLARSRAGFDFDRLGPGGAGGVSRGSPGASFAGEGSGASLQFEGQPHPTTRASPFGQGKQTTMEGRDAIGRGAGRVSARASSPALLPTSLSPRTGGVFARQCPPRLAVSSKGC